MKSPLLDQNYVTKSEGAVIEMSTPMRCAEEERYPRVGRESQGWRG